jgi:hypothetical protein
MEGSFVVLSERAKFCLVWAGVVLVCVLFWLTVAFALSAL